MPIFNYHCADCHADFELLVLSGSTPACAQCGSLRLEKQVSRVAAPGRSAKVVASARAQAKKEGHLSNFSAAELKR